MEDNATTGFKFSRHCILVQIADLLSQTEGLTIVHCPTQFETDLNRIFKDSLIGQLVTKAKQENADIDKQINSWCDDHKTLGHPQGCVSGRNIFFNIGELCPLKIGKQEIFLAAFNKSTGQDDLEPMTVGSYRNFWSKVWRNLQKMSKSKRQFIINVPVPGGYYVDDTNLYFSLNQKIGVIAESFFRFTENTAKTYTLRICVHQNNIKEENCEHWNTILLPYLYDRIHLERAIAEKSAPSDSTTKSEDVAIDWESIDDTIRKAIARLKAVNKESHFFQIRDRRREIITIEVNVKKLDKLEQIIVNNVEFRKKLTQFDGIPTEKKVLLKILNFLLEKTDVLGQLTATSCLKKLNPEGDNLNHVIEGKIKSLRAHMSKGDYKFSGKVTEYLLSQLGLKE